MRRTLWLAAAILVFAACAAAAAPATQMSVTVKQTDVRATPGYLGKSLGTLVYGDRVTLLDQPATAPKDWVKVIGPDNKLQGWVNRSALTEKKIVIASSSGGVQQTAASGDVALAGKGFNLDVEAQYKQDEKLDYTWVDKMQAFVVTPQQAASFITQGGLTEQGGAQ